MNLPTQLLRQNAMVIGAIAISLLTVSAVALLQSPNANADAIPAIGAENSPPIVQVATVTQENIRVWSNYSGRLQAVDYAELRPEVSGRIIEIRFQDGQTVKAGDILVVIDPSIYEAQVDRAAANVASAAAKAALTRAELDRAKNLIAVQAISQTVLDQRANDDKAAQANVKAAEAELKKAKIDLDHAYVKAPISGRVGRPEITVGNLVQATSAAPQILTTIVSNAGIYADFEVDEQTYVRSIRNTATTLDQEHQIPVELTLQNDPEHIYKGTIYSFDNHINSTTGTIRARAKFANEDGKLMPGMFAGVRMANGADDSALIIPEKAIGTDQTKKFAFIVGNDNKVAYRELTLGQRVNDKRIILKGLSAGDRVVIDGMQQIRTDMIVQIKSPS